MTNKTISRLLLATTFILYCCTSTDFVDSEDDGGSGSQDAPFCVPGSGKCVGNQIHTCNKEGSAYIAGTSCQWPTQCVYGMCQDPCHMAKQENSYMGCEYFAVDMDNIPDSPPYYSPRDGEYALVVSNATTSEKSVLVKIYAKHGGAEKVIAQGSVPSNDTKVFAIKPPYNVQGTSKTMKALRLVSDGPVTVYQFNPLNNTDKAYSNDASLLLPVASLDKDYIVTTGDGAKVGESHNRTNTHNAGSMVTVVGTVDNTTVTLTPTVDLLPGAGVTGGGKTPINVVLNRYEVLNVESRTPALTSTPKKGDANLSGTVVHADQPVAVFAGNVCGLYPLEKGPSGWKCCCDHMEEQFFPLSSWGKEFVATSTEPRLKGTSEKNYWRVTGGANSINLTYLPFKPAGAPSTINKGQSSEFKATTNFILKATGPVLLTEFIASSQDVSVKTGQYCTKHTDCDKLSYMGVCVVQYNACFVAGDPAMILVPPSEQFRTKYVFLTPKDYYYDYANIIGPVDAAIKLDGAPLGKPTQVGTIGNVNFGVIRARLTDGKHVITADKKVGVIVYGFDSFVSYGYPAGLELKKINPVK